MSDIEAELPDLSDILSISKLDDAQDLYKTIIPSDKAVPSSFWDAYTQPQQLIGLKACLAIYVTSGRRIFPREFQLKATMGLCTGMNVLIDVGTGYGKTFCMILPALLHPRWITIVISPLKKLQEMQVLEFRERGLAVLAINEDTPNTSALWKSVREGAYSVLIVQAEQFFIDKGHWPRLARLIHNPKFSRKIKFLMVDEAHNVHSLGLSHYSLPAFRPAWASLSELVIKLGSRVSVAALSGTLPKHIKITVRERLQLDEDSDKVWDIKLSCNRPNITPAIHMIVGTIGDYRNTKFMLSEDTGSKRPGRIRRKGIVFHDSVEGAVACKNWQEQQLLPELRRTGVIRVYNSCLSDECLKATYDDFRNADGICEILHATEAASTGLDLRDLYWVVQYGLSREMTVTLQRGGRCGRDGTTPSIFLIMYEKFALEVDLKAVDEEEKRTQDPRRDPDRPVAGKLKPKASKKERTGIEMLRLVQHPEKCFRKVFADYNGDETPEALEFTGPWCCNSSAHHGTETRPFDFAFYFPGKLLYVDAKTGITYEGSPSDPNRAPLDVPEPEPDTSKRKRKSRPKYRPVPFRKSLISRIEKWRHETWCNDPLRAVRPEYQIISKKSIDLLVRELAWALTTKEQVKELVLETSEEWDEKWADEVLKVVHAFDADVGKLEQKKKENAAIEKEKAKLEKEVQDAKRAKILFEKDVEERNRLAADAARLVVESFSTPSSSSGPRNAATPGPGPSTIARMLTGANRTSSLPVPVTPGQPFRQQSLFTFSSIPKPSEFTFDRNINAFQADNLRLQKEAEEKARAILAARRPGKENRHTG
ncbi:II DNA helicase [Ephemerocybe angulata]|uniref:DNA 3'-5' helicase n=1 Tax=Ephemerocybe angulata TaxID=980116 RepID=A0A8H6HE13_9AGAR|nr:II DNA helicase [Tulosesus angulatus]